MAETLVPNVTKLVALMLNGAETWTNSIYINKTAGGPLTDGDEPIADFANFMIQNISNNAFLEQVTGYEVFQRIEGETNVEHPPVFSTTYHLPGNRNANYGGSVPHGDPLPKDVVVYAKLSTSGGRSGKMFFRDNLWEGEVISTEAGIWTFNEADDRFTRARFITTVTDHMGEIMPGGAGFADHQWVVAHLLLKKPGDTRAAFVTPVTAANAIRPAWNRARR